MNASLELINIVITLPRSSSFTRYMAPNTVRTPTHTTTINMSNPNTAALALALRNRNGTQGSSS